VIEIFTGRSGFFSSHQGSDGTRSKEKNTNGIPKTLAMATLALRDPSLSVRPITDFRVLKFDIRISGHACTPMGHDPCMTGA